ncbi:MAG TPA: SPOR domain-containing protein [Sphingomonadaceae bacterium]|nr:SPOR domain-containing protein [Sphingomonadaceae bacterium]
MAIGDQYGEDGEPWGDEAPAGAPAARLALEDGEEQLPWLESDEDYEDEGVDIARIVAIAVIGLLAVVLVVGAIWWFTRERSDSALLADGSTISAPEGPYKSKPEDPGGKTFAGTGDTSFAVAEGKSREAKLAEDDLPRPTIDTKAASPVSSEDKIGGVGVQVGAYSNRESAEQGWQKLAQKFEALHGVSHRVVEGQADIGKVYRLQAVAADLAGANALCNTLKASGGACQVKP